METTRGTPVAPGIWIPGRTPAGVKPVAEKTLIKETRASKVSSSGSELTQLRAEGSLEFNVRVTSIGYLLKSLLGSLTSALKSGETAVYQHTLGILGQNPQHPSLALGLSQPNVQDYEYPLSLAKSLEIRTPVDDLVNATVEFVSKKEQEKTPAYSVSFPTNDYYFRHNDVTIKLASNLAGLDAASPIKVKEFNLAITNNARPDQNVSETNPSDVIATLIEISGSMKLDYLDKTNHDVFTSGGYKALRLELKRSDITIGIAGNPTIRIDLPRISFEGWNPDRPIDDIVREEIKFVGHYSVSDAKAIQGLIENEKANYNS